MGYTDSYSEIQKYKHCYLNSIGENDVSGTANDILETIVEGIPNQDDDETEVDAALDDQLLAETNESGMLANSHVMYTEVEETKNAVTQFVRHNMDLNIVSIWNG